MSEEIELKPCPFCGGEAVYHEGDETVWDFIFCSECDFIIHADEVYAGDKLKREWNRRPSLWISVDKETPKLGETVFIAIGDLPEYDIGVLTDSGWITMNHSLSSSKNIKYFMRKPELPKE